MIGRLPRIAGAYLAACVASGFALGLVLPFVGVLEGRAPVDVPPLPSLPSLLIAWLVAGGWATAFVAALALVPAVVVIAIAEAACLRSAAFYSSAGVVVAIVALAIFDLLPAFKWKGPTFLEPTPFLLIGAAGLVGGLVYWRIAGRIADDWRMPRNSS